jgi:hypothetical protein
MGLKTQMVSQLDLHRPLDQPLGQLRQQAAGPDDLLLRAGAREQLVDQLVTQPTAVGQLDRGAQPRAIDRPIDQIRRELQTPPARGTPRRRAQRFADGSLHSPYGLAPIPPNETLSGLQLDPAVAPAAALSECVRSHETPVRSCLHSFPECAQRWRCLSNS